MADLLYLSPTALKDFYTCPATLYFRQLWEVLDTDASDPGSVTHQIMYEGSIPSTLVHEPIVVQHVTKLRKLEAMLQIHALHREFRQSFEWPELPGIRFTRILDVIATTPQEEIVILDYKTGYVPWTVVEVTRQRRKVNISPQSLTFQAPGYLLPPPPGTDDDLLRRIGSWPKKLHFLVSPARGAAQEFPVELTPELKDNFIRAAQYAQKTVQEVPPIKNYGKHCDYCRFQALCFQSPGWKKMYKKRT